MSLELSASVDIDVAHDLAAIFPAGHPNHRLHGHRYTIEAVCAGELQAGAWVAPVHNVEIALQEIIFKALDHRYLNEIDGLALPTMENIARWCFERLTLNLSTLVRVIVYRGRHRVAYQP